MALAVRDLNTGLFLCKSGDWAIDPRIAQHFADEETLKKAALERGLKNAEMVFLNASYEIYGGVLLRLPDDGSQPK